jgi:hypothetical protein
MAAPAAAPAASSSSAKPLDLASTAQVDDGPYKLGWDLATGPTCCFGNHVHYLNYWVPKPNPWATAVEIMLFPMPGKGPWPYTVAKQGRNKFTLFTPGSVLKVLDRCIVRIKEVFLGPFDPYCGSRENAAHRLVLFQQLRVVYQSALHVPATAAPDWSEEDIAYFYHSNTYQVEAGGMYEPVGTATACRKGGDYIRLDIPLVRGGTKLEELLRPNDDYEVDENDFVVFDLLEYRSANITLGNQIKLLKDIEQGVIVLQDNTHQCLQKIHALRVKLEAWLADTYPKATVRRQQEELRAMDLRNNLPSLPDELLGEIEEWVYDVEEKDMPDQSVYGGYGNMKPRKQRREQAEAEAEASSNKKHKPATEMRLVL